MVVLRFYLKAEVALGLYSKAEVVCLKAQGVCSNAEVVLGFYSKVAVVLACDLKGTSRDHIERGLWESGRFYASLRSGGDSSVSTGVGALARVENAAAEAGALVPVHAGLSPSSSLAASAHFFSTPDDLHRCPSLK